MKKTILLCFLSLLCILPSCDLIKEELGLDTGKNEEEEKEQEEEKPQINVNVSKDPCAYFTFDGHYKDLSGNEKYAYGNPEPTFTTGPKSGTKALSFSRANGSLVVINDGLIDTSSMTVSLWIKDIDEGNIFWVTSSNNTNGHSEMMYLSYTNGHFRYVMDRYHCYYWSYEKQGHFTHKTIDDGEWHHVVLVSDHNRLKTNYVTTTLYIDGMLMDTVTEEYGAYNEDNANDRHFGTGTKFMIGGTNTPNMKIANLRVYDEWQMPADEIKKLYDKCM